MLFEPYQMISNPIVHKRARIQKSFLISVIHIINNGFFLSKSALNTTEHKRLGMHKKLQKKWLPKPVLHSNLYVRKTTETDDLVRIKSTSVITIKARNKRCDVYAEIKSSPLLKFSEHRIHCIFNNNNSIIPYHHRF